MQCLDISVALLGIGEVNMDAISGPSSYTPSNRVSSAISLSSSPSGYSHASSFSNVGSHLPRASVKLGSNVKQLKPFATEDFKILLLENVNKTGRDILARQGYQVEFLKTSLPEDELIERIRWSTSPFFGVEKIYELTCVSGTCMS